MEEAEQLPERSITDQLVDLKILIDTKQRFTALEQQKIYEMYNWITGEKKQPNGCSSCLNNTITRLKKEFRANGI